MSRFFPNACKTNCVINLIYRFYNSLSAYNILPDHFKYGGKFCFNLKREGGVITLEDIRGTTRPAPSSRISKDFGSPPALPWPSPSPSPHPGRLTGASRDPRPPAHAERCRSPRRAEAGGGRGRAGKGLGEAPRSRRSRRRRSSPAPREPGGGRAGGGAPPLR